MNPKWAEWATKRKVKQERESEQIEQVVAVLADGKEHSIMEIVDAVNAMPRAMLRMEPARVWKIVRDLYVERKVNRSQELTASGRLKRWIVKLSPNAMASATEAKP